MIIGYGFGYGAFFIPLIFGSVGLYLLNFPKIKPLKLIVKFTFAAILLSLILGLIFGESKGYLISGPGGAQGYLITRWMNAFMGMIGTGIIMAFLTISYLVFALRVKPASFGLRLPAFLKFNKPSADQTVVTEDGAVSDSESLVRDKVTADKEIPGNNKVEFVVKNTTINLDPEDPEEEIPEVLTRGSIIHDFDSNERTIAAKEESPINITRPDTGEHLSEQEVAKKMENYDPRLDLSRYKFPPVSILKDHKSESAFDNNEVFENKENIIKTLGDHKIAIKSISATVGPTVTLYEIVPERGVRLARIKSLEDDISLNLSALGIRIIAPIPGRGTVGIEVPNKKPEIVYMRSPIT